MKKIPLLLILFVAMTAEARVCRTRRHSRVGRSTGSSLRWQLPSANDMMADQIKRLDMEKQLLIKRRELERLKQSIERERKMEQFRQRREQLQYEKQLQELEK